MVDLEAVSAAHSRLTAAYREHVEAESTLRRVVEDALLAEIPPSELCRVLGVGRLDLARFLNGQPLEDRTG